MTLWRIKRLGPGGLEGIDLCDIQPCHFPTGLPPLVVTMVTRRHRLAGQGRGWPEGRAVASHSLQAHGVVSPSVRCCHMVPVDVLLGTGGLWRPPRVCDPPGVGSGVPDAQVSAAARGLGCCAVQAAVG